MARCGVAPLWGKHMRIPSSPPLSSHLLLPLPPLSPSSLQCASPSTPPLISVRHVGAVSRGVCPPLLRHAAAALLPHVAMALPRPARALLLRGGRGAALLRRLKMAAEMRRCAARRHGCSHALHRLRRHVPCHATSCHALRCLCACLPACTVLRRPLSSRGWQVCESAVDGWVTIL